MKQWVDIHRLFFSIFSMFFLKVHHRVESMPNIKASLLYLVCSSRVHCQGRNSFEMLCPRNKVRFNFWHYHFIKLIQEIDLQSITAKWAAIDQYDVKENFDSVVMCLANTFFFTLFWGIIKSHFQIFYSYKEQCT